MTLRRIMRAINDIPQVNPMLGTGEEEDTSSPPSDPSDADRYGVLEIPRSS
ncbi:MAG: hypothetical protein V4671_04260 [Armatimonadota bacterium]